MVRDQYGERGDGLLTEERALGDFDGLAEATHREVHEAAVALLGGVEEVHEESCTEGVRKLISLTSRPEERAAYAS